MVITVLTGLGIAAAVLAGGFAVAFGLATAATFVASDPLGVDRDDANGGRRR